MNEAGNIGGVLGGFSGLAALVAAGVLAYTQFTAARRKARGDDAELDDTILSKKQIRDAAARKTESDELYKIVARQDEQLTRLERKLEQVQAEHYAIQRDYARAAARIEFLEAFCRSKGLDATLWNSDEASGRHQALPPGEKP